ncbi:MAG: hypothetical protein H0T42_24045 [Deltaproteobacteria bacterium]|nr:hypothetical protein [Deltaproteobacteria bacterium]
MRRVAVTLGLALTACSVPALDLTGKRCPCPTGWDCAPATNTCTREATPVDSRLPDDSGVDAFGCAGPDEDADGRGDACDVCPGDADNGQDSDDDGVGDVCDPSPLTRERIAFFEGFHTLPATWTIDGPWRQVGDDLVSDSGAGTISNFTIVDPVPNQVSYLVTRLTVGDLFDPQGSTNYVGLVRQLDTGPDSNVRCLVTLTPTDGMTWFGLRDTGGLALRSEVAYPYATGQVERFQFRRSGTDYSCASTTETRTGTTSVTAAQPRLGLRTRSGAATFHWVMLLVQD